VDYNEEDVEDTERTRKHQLVKHSHLVNAADCHSLTPTVLYGHGPTRYGERCTEMREDGAASA